jgi:hypothetical protein
MPSRSLNRQTTSRIDSPCSAEISARTDQTWYFRSCYCTTDMGSASRLHSILPAQPATHDQQASFLRKLYNTVIEVGRHNSASGRCSSRFGHSKQVRIGDSVFAARPTQIVATRLEFGLRTHLVHNRNLGFPQTVSTETGPMTWGPGRHRDASRGQPHPWKSCADRLAQCRSDVHNFAQPFRQRQIPGIIKPRQTCPELSATQGAIGTLNRNPGCATSAQQLPVGSSAPCTT